MAMEVQFQPARRADADQLLQLMEEYYRFDQIPFDPKIARAALDELLGNPTLGCIWLIQRGSEVIGYLALTFVFSLEFHGRNAVIDELYLRQEFRGRGIGTRAVRYVEEVCRAWGVPALHLEVERENEDAQEFWRRCGFEDHDRYLMTKWLR
jgi:GNAT superfamily N-acetyltransferase